MLTADFCIFDKMNLGLENSDIIEEKIRNYIMAKYVWYLAMPTLCSVCSWKKNKYLRYPCWGIYDKAYNILFFSNYLRVHVRLIVL